MNLSFTFIDYLVLAVILISAGYAAWRGFMSETLMIFAWVAAGFATLYFGPWLVPMARDVIAVSWLASMAAYAGVFLVAFIPLSFLSHRVSQSVKNSPVGALDRVLGFAFGAARGLIVIGLAYLSYSHFTPERRQPHWIQTARTLPLVRSTAKLMLAAIPSQLPRDYVTTGPAGGEDSLGALIRRQNEQANQASVPKRGEKTYGATDRRALDRLFETSGGSGKP